MKFNAEYRNGRTLTLNSDAGQLVEAQNKGLIIGIGYKIVGFNTILKMRGSGHGISNDLTLQADFSLQENQALIRRIESAYTLCNEPPCKHSRILRPPGEHAAYIVVGIPHHQFVVRPYI